MSIHIITDSASDMNAADYQNLTVLPLTITFGTEEYEDGVTLSKREFYEKLVASEDLPSTSQVTPFAFAEAMRAVTARGDTAIVITISSQLSGTYQSACLAAEEVEGAVYVIDSETATVAESVLVEYALCLVEQGMAAEALVSELNRVKKNIRLVAMVNTLEYLKRGGRVSKAVAFAGGLLSIKPIIAVADGVVKVLGKSRGAKQASQMLTQEVLAMGGIDTTKPYHVGYTGVSDELARQYACANPELWDVPAETMPLYPIGGTIGTHAGPGGFAVAWVVPEKQ